MPLLPPKEQYEADVRAQQNKQRLFRRKFAELLPGLVSLAADVRASMPEGTDDRTFLRNLSAQVNLEPAVRALFDAHMGQPGQIELQPKMVKAFTEVAAGKKTYEAIRPTLDAVAAAVVQVSLLAQSQEPLASIPPDIRAFLPPKIAIEVDPSGTLLRLTDRFANEERTLEVKIHQLKAIMRNIDQIRNQLDLDLSSDQEACSRSFSIPWGSMRIAALITLLILETGIRPGDIGTAAHVFEEVEGERKKVLVETFGATTLKTEHVVFLPDGTAELRFVGKKGTLNFALVRNPVVVSALRSYFDRASQRGLTDLFVMENGKKFTYRMLLNYFALRFPDYDPTDFRKLRAAEVAYRSIKESQAQLFQEIRSYLDLSEDQLRARVLMAVRDVVANAVEQARAGLSHKDKSETIESYLDPRIILQFLSRGQVAETLRDAILDDSLTIRFDPLDFSRMAASRSNPRTRHNPHDTMRSILSRLRASMLQD